MAVSVVANSTDASLLDMMLDVSTELMWFLIGVAVFRLSAKSLRSHRAAPRQPKAQRKINGPKTVDPSPATLADWKEVKASGRPVSIEKAKALGKALATLYPGHLDDFVSFLGQHLLSIPVDTSMVNAWLSTLASTGKADRMQAFAEAVEARLGVASDARGDELLLGAAVAVGDDDKVQERIIAFTSQHASLTAGACEQLAWGYLCVKDIAEAARWTHGCFSRSAAVPPVLLSSLFKAAGELGPGTIGAVLDCLRDEVVLTSECAAVALRACLLQEDVAMARRVQRLVAGTGIVLAPNAREAVLKLYARAGDPDAVAFFKDSVAIGFVASQGFCGSVLSRCAESKFLELAVAIGEHLMAHDSPSLATYKTLMKAYACCGAFDHACKLYLHLEQEGPQPDELMRVCVMRFAMLSEDMPLCMRIMDQAVTGNPQVLCSLIRAAGRDGNAQKVSELLHKVDDKVGLHALDISVLNVAMEMCWGSSCVELANRLFEQATASGQADSKTFSTMIKGQCAFGDFDRAEDIIEEMVAAGHPPEGDSLLNAIVAAGDMRRAWAVFSRLERRGAVIDVYALSIMMKAARNSRTTVQAEPFLGLVDKRAPVICTNTILFNTALDACIQHRDTDRLAALLDAYGQSDVPASVQTYGLLIKASSSLGREGRCKELWNEMTKERALQPNTKTLGCMIDALVTSHQVEDAVSLFKEWKRSVALNTIIYSTLMKGFAYAGDADRAMEIFRELKRDGHSMNLVSYTTLIDAHARAGNMVVATDLLNQMEKNGCEPNHITFSTLIKGHCLQGDMDSALNCFQDMLARGLLADAVVFNTLLDSCVKHGQFELADGLLAVMRSRSVAPSNFTLAIVTKMWGKRGQLDKAFEAVHLSIQEHVLLADAKNGNSLISACFTNKSPSRAIQAFEEMRSWRRHRGFSGPDDSTFGTLIAGLARSGRLREAASYAQEACSGSPPRISLSAGSPTTGVAALKLLFRELSNEGLCHTLGGPILQNIESAGERSLFNALSQVGTTAPTGSRRSSRN